MPCFGMLRRVVFVRTRRFGGIYRLPHQDEKIQRARILFLRSVLRLLATATVVPSSPILLTLMMMVTIRSFKTSVPTRALERNIPEGGIILHSHRRENLKILHSINRLGTIAET
jgi:hypothetical protein